MTLAVAFCWQLVLSWPDRDPVGPLAALGGHMMPGVESHRRKRTAELIN